MKKLKYLILVIPIIIVIIGVVILIINNNQESSYGILKTGKGFSTYEFNIKKMEPQSIERVNEGYVMISNINNNIGEDYDNDLRIAKYDETFNRLWSYDYYHDESKYMADDYERKENKYLIAYVEKMIESNDKLFFLIYIYSSSTGYSNTRLLILNNDGTLYDNHRFEEDITSVISIEDKIITLYSLNGIYMYNYENNRIDKFDIDEFNENSFNILDKKNEDYLVATSVNYYIDDSGNQEHGTNSLYLLDKSFNEKKSLNLDDLIGVNDVNISYEDIRVINERIYVSYSIHGDVNTYGYPGLLVIDKNLNVISNIIYTHEVTEKKFKEVVDYEVLDYYVYNGELYVLVSNNDYSNAIIDKYDAKGKEIGSYKIKSLLPKAAVDTYTSMGYRIINCDGEEIIYYAVFSDDFINNKKDIYKSILKFGKVEL